MNTVSRDASPNQALLYRAAKQLASQHVWRNTWQRGIQSAGNTSQGYKQSKRRLRVVVPGRVGYFEV